MLKWLAEPRFNQVEGFAMSTAATFLGINIQRGQFWLGLAWAVGILLSSSVLSAWAQHRAGTHD